MTTTSLPHNPAEILASVEEYFAELPEKRRRKRTKAEIYAPVDLAPETENYAPAPEPLVTIELDSDALTLLPRLLGQLGRARSDVVAQTIILKILDLLGLELEGGK